MKNILKNIGWIDHKGNWDKMEIFVDVVIVICTISLLLWGLT